MAKKNKRVATASEGSEPEVKSQKLCEMFTRLKPKADLSCFDIGTQPESPAMEILMQKNPPGLFGVGGLEDARYKLPTESTTEPSASNIGDEDTLPDASQNTPDDFQHDSRAPFSFFGAGKHGKHLEIQKSRKIDLLDFLVVFGEVWGSGSGAKKKYV